MHDVLFTLICSLQKKIPERINTHLRTLSRINLLSLRWTTQNIVIPPGLPHALLPPALALAPPTTYPTHGREPNKTKEDVRADGQRFSSGRKGHPKQGGSTYRVSRNWRSSLPWIFWGEPVCCCKIVVVDGESRPHPYRRKHQASSVDSPLFKSISEAS